VCSAQPKQEDDFIRSGGIDLIVDFMISGDDERIEVGAAISNRAVMVYPHMSEVLGTDTCVVKQFTKLLVVQGSCN